MDTPNKKHVMQLANVLSIDDMRNVANKLFDLPEVTTKETNEAR